ncbi:unnamed protein product [Ectocarpus sp. 12 AP-2014]
MPRAKRNSSRKVGERCRNRGRSLASAPTSGRGDTGRSLARRSSDRSGPCSPFRRRV